MNRRCFLKTAAGLFIPCAPALLLPSKTLAQLSGGAMFPGPGVKAYSGGSESTVLIDVINDNTVNQSGNGVATFSIANGTSINVGSGPNGTSNRCLIAIAMFGSQNGGTSTVTDMTWDFGVSNQAMTKIPGANIGNGATGGDIEMWYLMAPLTGDKNFKMNWTGNNQVMVNLVSFVNVDQTGGTTSFPTVNTSTSSGKTINISTSPTTRKLVGAFNSGSNFTTATDNDIGHSNTMNIFAVASEWAAGTNTLVSYGGGGSGCSLAVAIKGA